MFLNLDNNLMLEELKTLLMLYFSKKMPLLEDAVKEFPIQLETCYKKNLKKLNHHTKLKLKTLKMPKLKKKLNQPQENSSKPPLLLMNLVTTMDLTKVMMKPWNNLLI